MQRSTNSLVLFLVLSFLSSTLQADSPVNFSREIRPILAENCFACHGPDEKTRKAGLRLDVEVSAKSANAGTAAVVPGKPELSALIHRIESNDPDEVMPPPALHKTVSSLQFELIRKWISEGATWGAHWSFEPLVFSDSQPREQPQSIDSFVQVQLKRMGLEPSPEASKETLIRRVTLDLTGLPPTLSEVEAFLMDSSGQAYEKLVDRLLQSPHYGERMAVDWLDAARYADTNGYQVDRDRELWPWRDWVIQAFNENMPFDQFTIEQLAGDLLPEPTLQQRIATGFHRNHMLNEEGGIIGEEFLAEYTADRVETTAAIWLGQTFNCARCHDHKFDPFTQRDFYSLKAFFHNVPELGVGIYGNPIRRNAPPFVRLPSPENDSKLAEYRATSADLEKQIAESRLSKDQAHLQLSEQLAKLKKQIEETEDQIPTSLVMEEMSKPRETFTLLRGAYDKPVDEVTAATPAVLPPLELESPRNRLGLARWLMSPNNPLTARVTVNRFWQQVFGKGLVVTSEDFGSQGALPTHPELLDWLAIQFIQSGWNVKQLMKRMVTSATYRQQSQRTETIQLRDPENILLARSPRFRLMGEFVRDQALAVSGLLVTKIGGPSVKPYHPPGLYEQLTAGNGYNVYVEGTGEELHRRSLYTYWKRSVPHPAMLLFDAPFRESCTLRRPRTNTPLQALNLLNDPTYIEAARGLATRMMRDVEGAMDDRLIYGFRRLLARKPLPEELRVLRSAFEQAQLDYRQNPASANSLLNVGLANLDAQLDASELAALTIVASIMLNLDEAVHRE